MFLGLQPNRLSKPLFHIKSCLHLEILGVLEAVHKWYWRRIENTLVTNSMIVRNQRERESQVAAGFWQDCRLPWGCSISCFDTIQVIAWVRSSCTVIAASADASLSVWEMSKKTFREVGAWGASGSGFCTPQSLSVGICTFCIKNGFWYLKISVKMGSICFASRKRATICFHCADRSYSLRPHTCTRHTGTVFSILSDAWLHVAYMHALAYMCWPVAISEFFIGFYGFAPAVSPRWGL